MTNQEIRDIVAAVSKTMANNKDWVFCYISGKVTGLTPEEVKLKFAITEAQMIQKGTACFNPSTHIKPDCDWKQAMKLCIAILPMCDFIYMQKDWRSSDGAKKERDIALTLGITVFYEELQKTP